MAKPKLLKGESGSDTYVGDGVGIGASPEVSEGSMEADNRVITSVSQAINATQSDIDDARNLVVNAKRITAKKQGAPPYNPAKLKAQGKSHKRNVSTRFLQKELARAASRFYMPWLTASTLTAASLPAGWVDGQKKTAFFRDTITRAIRGNPKWDTFVRGIGTEVTDYGFGFAVFTDRYQWFPHLVRMDRGFVPKGSEIMDSKLGRFTLKWDYRPDDLLTIVRKAEAAGSEMWNKDAVAQAVDKATSPKTPNDMSQLRKWEEMKRAAPIQFDTTRSQRMVETRHLFVLEFSGKVSHYILWPDGPADSQLLFEHLDAYESTAEIVQPFVFGYGDGTIQGSWGAGQLLYELAAQVEKIRCDSMDNLLNSNKQKIQVANAKDAAAVQLLVNDTHIIVSGGQFAQNTGGISGNVEGYMALDDRMTQWAQEVIGSYLPPIPLTGKSDIKAAQVNAAQQREQEVQRDVLEYWLKQGAHLIATMSRRLCDKDSDDDYAKATREKLLGNNVGWFKNLMQSFGESVRQKIPALEKVIPPAPTKLTEEELAILLNQPVIQSVTDFTEFAASQRAQFAASVQGNALFNQEAVARYMAAGVPSGGDAFVDSIVTPKGDVTNVTWQTRQQIMENAAMLTLGQPVPVVITDMHTVHWDALVQPLEQAIMQGLIQPAVAGLKHLGDHYAAGLSTKTWPTDRINTDKATLARLQRSLEAKQQEMAQPPSGNVTPMPAQAAVV